MSDGFSFKVEYAGTAPTQDLVTRLADGVQEKRPVAASSLGLDCAPVQIRQSTSRLPVAFTHKDEVMSLAFSPDGKTLVAGGEDATLVLWDVASHCRMLEADMDAPILSVTFAGSGEHFAAGNVDSLVALWSAEDNEQVATDLLEGEVLALAFAMSPGYLLAAGTTAKHVVLMTVPELQEIAELRHEGHVRCLSFSPSGYLLAGCGTSDDSQGLVSKRKEGRQTKTSIWQLANEDDCRYVGALVFDDAVHATAFSPSGKLVAVGGEGRCITLFLADRDYELASELPVSAGVRCLAWSSCGRFLASGGEDLQVTVWDVLLERVMVQMPKASDWYISVAFSSDNQWLAACGYGSNDVSLFALEWSDEDLPTRAEAGSDKRKVSLVRPKDFQLTKSKGTVKTLPDFVAAEGAELKVEKVLSDKDADKPDEQDKDEQEKEKEVAGFLGQPLLPQKLERNVLQERVMLPHQDDVLALTFSPDGQRLVAGGEDGVVVLWEVATRSRIMEPQVRHPVRAVAYSPGGDYIAAADMNANVTVWSTSDKEEVGKEQVDGDPLTLALTSTPVDMLAVGTTEKKVVLFSLPDMEELAELNHEGHVHCIAFSWDGRLLAGGGGTNDMHGLITKKATHQEMKTLVWKVSPEKGRCKHLISLVLEGVVNATAFSPTGKLLAVGCQNRMIAVMLIDGDYDEVSKLRSTAGVRCLSWCSNPHFLASGGEDMQVSVWDVISERIVFQLPKENDWICSIAFDIESKWLATCCYGSSYATLHPVWLKEEEPQVAPQPSEPELDQWTAEPERGNGLHIAVSVPSYKAPKSNLKAPADLSPLMSKGTVKSDSLAALEKGKSSNQLSPRGIVASVVDLGDNSAGFHITISNVDANEGKNQPRILGLLSKRPPGCGSPCGIRLCESRAAAHFSHSDEVLGLAFSPDSGLLLAGGEDTMVTFWDMASRSKQMSVKVGCAVAALACSPSGDYVAAASASSFITLWKLKGCSQVGKTKLQGQVLSLAMASYPEELLAVGSSSKSAVLLSVPDLEELAVLRHDGCVRSVAFSPDGGLLAGGGGAEEAHCLAGMKPSVERQERSAKKGMKTVIWKAAPDGEQCKYLGAIHVKASVHATAFSPSGKLLALGGEERLLSTLEVDNGFKLGTELPSSASVRCLAWASNSLFLASGGEDLQVSVWDVAAASVAFRLPKASDWPCAVAFSPDDRWLAWSAFGSAGVALDPVEVWTANEAAAAAVTSIQFPEDSTAEAEVLPLAPRCKNRRASVEVPAGRGFEVCVHSRRSSTDSQPDVVRTSSAPAKTAGSAASLGPKIAIVGPSGAPPPLPSSTGPAVAAPDKKLGTLMQPHCFEPLKSVGTVKFSPTDEPAAPLSLSFSEPPSDAPKGTLSKQGRMTDGFEIRIVKVGGRQEVDLVTRMAPRKSVASIALGMDLRPLLLRACTNRDMVRLEHKDEVVGLAMSPNGETVVAGGEDRFVVVWNLKEQVRVFEVRMSAAIAAVAYSPCGQYVAACDIDSSVEVWDTNSHEEAGSTQIDGEPLSLAMTSRSHGLLAVGTTSKTVLLMSMPKLEEITELRHDGHVHSLAFSPDGCTLAGGGGTDDMHGLMTRKANDGAHEMKTVMWRVAQREEECKYLGSILFEDIVHATAFSPTGKLLAVGGENRMIAMLVVEQDFNKASELPCAAGVRCLAWSPNSRFLAEGGEDMQVSVWDVLAESIVFQLPKAKDWIHGLAFTQDMCWLATCGYGDSAVTLHPLEEKDPEDDEEDSDNDSESEDEDTPDGTPTIAINVTVAS